METVVTTGALRRAKLQSNRHHQQQTTAKLLQVGYPSCRTTKSGKTLKVTHQHPLCAVCYCMQNEMHNVKAEISTTLPVYTEVFHSTARSDSFIT